MRRKGGERIGPVSDLAGRLGCEVRELIGELWFERFVWRYTKLDLITVLAHDEDTLRIWRREYTDPLLAV